MSDTGPKPIESDEINVILEADIRLARLSAEDGRRVHVPVLVLEMAPMPVIVATPKDEEIPSTIHYFYLSSIDSGQQFLMGLADSWDGIPAALEAAYAETPTNDTEETVQ